MENGVIAKGELLSASNGQRWIIGSFIGLNGITESYEAALYNDKTPTDYPAILQIVLCGDEPLPLSFQFYTDHAKPNDLGIWKRANQAKHLGIAVLLGAGSLDINNQNYKFIVIERHGKDLWSLFLEHKKKFEAHTVYKITLQIITILKYIHSKSYVQGDIKGSNIVVDIATQNHIYLMDDYVASDTISDDQVDPNKLKSRDTQMGVSTMRGDMETLFYNLVQWLGIEFPWEKNLENLSVVQKEDAFADIDTFLQSWSKETSIPAPVCEFMKLLATMDTNDKPTYWNFKCILVNGLRKLYHVPTGKLEFSISNVPIVEQIAEDSNQVNKLQRRRKQLTTIPNIGNSVVKLANIIAENCRHECEVKLREVGPDSLIDIICQLTFKKKDNIKWQNKLANAWERDTAGLKTMTKSLWREKELQAKGITSEAASTQNEHEEPSQDSTATAAASAQENTNGLNHSNPAASNSQTHCEPMSPDRMPPQEHTAPLDLPNIPPPNVRQTARSPSPSRWSGAQSSPIRPSTSGYSSRSSMQDDSHFENMSSSRTSEQFFDTEHYRVPEVVVLKVKRETGRTNEEVTECWRSESVGCESWRDKYEMLNTWLKMKEPYLDAFGSIPSEQQMVVDRVQQVRVLLDDFRTRNPRRQELANVLAKLPRDSGDALKLEQIEHRWWKLLDWLEKHGQELGEASFGQPLDALQDVSNSLDKLLLDNEPEEQQLSKIAILAERLEGLQRTLLANATTLAEQLCRALSSQVYTSGLRVKLRSVETFYSDLQQKIRIKRTEVANSLSDGRQFDDLCKDTSVWLVKELANILEKPLVSTDRVTLQQQQDHYKVKCQRVMDKETEVMQILEKGRNLSRPHNILDSIKSQWDRLNKQSLDVVNKLKTCAESCDKFYQTQDLFLRWLSEADRKLESAKPASLDDIGKQLKELSTICNEVREKSGEFEQCINLGHIFIGTCDVDKDNVVENELSATKDRWAKLNHDLLNRLQSFEDMGKHLAGFNRSLLDLQQKIELYENESASHDALEAAAKDSQFLHRIKELKMQTVSLQEPLDVARQQADDLVLRAREQGIDASHLLDVVNHVVVRIENLKTKCDDIRNDILEQEHARFLKEINGNKPIEGPSRDSNRKESRRKTHSERRQDRDSELNGRGRSKKTSESSSRNRRSHSKDSVSSPPRSSISSNSSKSHNNDKNDDSRPDSDLNPSKPKRFRNSRDSDDLDRDSRLPRHDKARQDTSHSRNSYYGFDRSPSRSSNHKHHWQKQYFERRPQSRQAYFSNAFRNFDRRDRAQSVSHCDSRFGRDIYGWRSRNPRENLGSYYYQNQPFRNTVRENSTYRQATTARNCEPNGAEERERQRQQDDMREKYGRSDERHDFWNRLKQSENAENQLERDSQRVNKPLVSYASDEDDRDCGQFAVEREDQQKEKKE